jgi:outer membrane lipoprotein carrier protein
VRRIAALAAVALLAVGAPSLAARQGPQGPQGPQSRALGILEAASVRYEAVHTLCANFVQQLDVTLLKEKRTGRGRLCQERPDRFAMRFTEPRGDAVVMDGSSVWIYYRSLDSTQVVKYPMTDAPGGYDFQRQFLTDPGSKYTATYEARERIAGHSCDRIALAPKQEMSFKSAVVWVDAADHLLRQVRVVDENGSVRTITLETVEIDAKVPASWFTFTPPPGVRVISPPRGSAGG